MKVAKDLINEGYRPANKEQEIMIDDVENITNSIDTQLATGMDDLANQDLPDDHLDEDTKKLVDDIIKHEEFRKLKHIIESPEWKTLIEGWVIPEKKISQFLENYGNLKKDIAMKLNIGKPKLTPTDKRIPEIKGIEQLLDELDVLQEYFQGKTEIKVWDEEGKNFFESMSKLQMLTNKCQQTLDPLVKR